MQYSVRSRPLVSLWIPVLSWWVLEWTSCCARSYINLLIDHCQAIIRCLQLDNYSWTWLATILCMLSVHMSGCFIPRSVWPGYYDYLKCTSMVHGSFLLAKLKQNTMCSQFFNVHLQFKVKLFTWNFTLILFFECICRIHLCKFEISLVFFHFQ